MKTLSQICEIVSDKLPVNELINANLTSNYISTENMLPNKGGVVAPSSVPTTGKVTAYKTGDVLVSNIRPYFKKIWFASNDGGCSNDVLVFRARKDISPEYLHYVLADDSFFDYAMKTSKGTKMPRGDKISIMAYEIEEFDILDFISWLKQTVSIQTPELKAYLGEEDENYDNVADNVVCMFDKNVCEGIRIVYQGRLYDYSIYKSRKKNEHIY